MVNVYIVYKLIHATTNTNIVLKNCLFGAVKVTNISNLDPDKCQYSDYGICFDLTGTFRHPDCNYGKNVITFGVHMNNSRHVKQSLFCPWSWFNTKNRGHDNLCRKNVFT